jgi:hypothetical protein
VKLAHAVNDGTVFCGVKGKAIDVISCYGCERMVTIDLDTTHPKVVCMVPAAGEQTPSATSS